MPSGLAFLAGTYPEANMTTRHSPLEGIRVLDLSRILAGPTCTQLLGDLGADIIKVEQPGAGDDTRKWGPPYVRDAEGCDTTESAYYLCANRNKRSLSVALNKPQGQKLIRDLSQKCDIFIENFKVGGLRKYGLDYETLKVINPRLIYCSISGFGQTGPAAAWAGYDFLIQAMGGIMSITGPGDGDPHKVGLGIADVMCGMYASSAILAALHHRNESGEGQYVDISLLDSQVAWLINSGLNYLTSGEVPQRLGNAHPSIVPYEIFPSSDGCFALGVGNDRQYQKFCDFAACPELAVDERFLTNSQRVRNRKQLIPDLCEITARHPTRHWLDGLAALGVPCGPVNNIKQVFDDPQIKHRDMQIKMPHPLAGTGEVSLIGNPIKLSGTPVSYRRPPPTLGQHSDEVLEELLGLETAAITRLRRDGVI